MRRARNFIFFHLSMPKTKTSSKDQKDKAVNRKADHEIKWNPNSAHTDEKIQLSGEEQMEQDFELFKRDVFTAKDDQNDSDSRLYTQQEVWGPSEGYQTSFR